MKGIQVTLYDIFGYLFPGSIFLAALSLSYWTAFSLPNPNLEKVTAWSLVGISMVAYLLGHLVQALGNTLVRKSTVQLVLDPREKALPVEVIEAAHARAAALLGLARDVALSRETVFDACDHFVQHKGKTASRDIYVYREGFYRGMVVATLAIALALVGRACVGGVSLQVFGQRTEFSVTQLLALSVLCGCSAVLFFRRFRRFGTYLVKYALYSTLIGSTPGKPEKA
jgi:hypothetical protein